MNPQLVTSAAKTIVGLQQDMTYAAYNPTLLWQRFMPRRKEIPNTVGEDLYSIQVFSATFWEQFDTNTLFDKWVGIEVPDGDTVPADMKLLTIPAGLYAVFTFVGNEQMAPAFFEQIFSKWLPESIYELDNRPHFEILGSKYERHDPASEETIWIPVKLKKNVS
jgi:AraC family transcriptional regulator